MTVIRRLAPAALSLLIVGCQSTGGARVQELEADHRPALDSDEAGLWMMADESERAVYESGRVEQDQALNAYVSGIVCRLVPDHCPQIRVHIVRTPGFNATMSPNGYMQVWTGLMLRADNEDQLAYVLGHEVGHYLRRHSVQRWRAIRGATDATTFLQVLTAAAGVPVVGQLGSYVALGGLLAYSRDHEREADDVGFMLMARAGYDPNEAPVIWEALLEEREAEKDPQPSLFFSTHPSPRERIENLRAMASEAAARAAPTPPERAAHAAELARFRFQWLSDEMRERRHDAVLVLLDRLARHPGATGIVDYYRGETYRLRDMEGDAPRAVAAYRSAIGSPDTPVEAHRSLGLLLWRSGDVAGAREAFLSYLSASPQAADREMVASYLARMGD